MNNDVQREDGDRGDPHVVDVALVGGVKAFCNGEVMERVEEAWRDNAVKTGVVDDVESPAEGNKVHEERASLLFPDNGAHEGAHVVAGRGDAAVGETDHEGGSLLSVELESGHGREVLHLVGGENQNEIEI